MKRFGQVSLAVIFIFTLVVSASAQKVKLGTATKIYPPFYLLILGAEEKGIWKQNGLEVEWFPFGSSPEHLRAVTARSVDMGFEASVSLLQGVARGVPAKIICQELARSEFRLWVKTDSPIREPKQLKGTKIGVARLLTSSHAFARIIAEVEGVAKDVRYVGPGGAVENVAALRAGAVDAAVQTLSSFAELYVTGQVRQVALVADYLPKDWVEMVVHSRSDFAKSQPEAVKRVLRALSQSADFVLKNPVWSIEKMKSVSNYSDKAARLFYEETVKDIKLGKIEKRALENVINFLVKYDIIPKETAPSIEGVYSDEFLP